MLDFKELSSDGNGLEQLIREILLIKGYRVQWSGKGPDGGRDLICYETHESEFLNDRKTWLIQCKHKVKNAVGKEEIDDINDSCAEHNAQAYLLVCSSYPSSALVTRLEKITANKAIPIIATYWDGVKIEQLLSTPRLWRLAQRFFPVSSKNSSWEIYATDSPNHWIANYRGYHFHLSNRIGSRVDFHFGSIDDRINDIESFNLPEGHCIRLRAVYFNDKIGAYEWFLDYMYDNNLKPVVNSAQIADGLGDGWSLDDGQIYGFDVITRPYNPDSDHYDIDHYSYYTPYLRHYQNGFKRELEFHEEIRTWNEEKEVVEQGEAFRKESFEHLQTTFKKLKCAKLLRATNAELEKLPLFTNLLDWVELIEKVDLKEDRFFSALFVFEVLDKAAFFKFITYLPQEISPTFSLYNRYVCIPDGEGSRIDLNDQDMFELTVHLMAEITHNVIDGRNELNTYMKTLADAAEKYILEKEIL